MDTPDENLVKLLEDYLAGGPFREVTEIAPNLTLDDAYRLQFPSTKELPETLASLPKLNALEIREATFEQDVSHLIAETKLTRRLNPYQLLRDHRILLLALLCVIVAAATLSVYWARPIFLMTPERARAQLAVMGPLGKLYLGG